MNVIDLTHLIREDVLDYPSTRIDAPAHIVGGTKRLDEYPVGHFVGQAHLIDLSSGPGGTIGTEVIERNAAAICGKAFVIFRTGWSKRWGKPDYLEGFPVLGEDAALRLCDFGLRGVGVDAISVDRVGAEAFAIGKILARHGLAVVKNLVNLEAVSVPSFIFSCLPLRAPGSDCSPTRAVAIEI